MVIKTTDKAILPLCTAHDHVVLSAFKINLSVLHGHVQYTN